MGAGKFAAGSGKRRISEAELAARLRQLPVGEGPDPRFKAELRSQLVAIAPRIVAESASTASPTATGGTPAPRTQGGLAVFRQPLSLLRRPLITFVGAAAVLVLLLGVAVWMAGGALPGQSLYGVKRASENFQLSLAGSDTAKGNKYLKYATSRAAESTKLVNDAPADSRIADLVASTLRSADSDTRNGVRLISSSAVSQSAPGPFGIVASWAGQQRAEIAALAGYLPSGPARSQASSSIALLQQVAVRMNQLKAELGCGCLTTAHSDALGPVPCTTGCQQRRPASLTGPSGVGAGTSGSAGSGQPTAGGSLPTAPSLPGVGGSGTGGALPPPGLPTAIPSELPSSLPTGGALNLPGVGISVGSGGISLSVGPTLP